MTEEIGRNFLKQMEIQNLMRGFNGARFGANAPQLFRERRGIGQEIVEDVLI